MIFTRPGLLGLVESLVWVILSLGICIPGFYFLKKFENNHFPVLQSVMIDHKGIDRDGFDVFDLSFAKMRECTPLLPDFAWYIKTSKGWERVYFKIPANKGSVNRPLGENFSPGWLVDLTHYTEAEKSNQMLIMEHSCHPLWNSRTITYIINNKVAVGKDSYEVSKVLPPK